MRLKRRDKTDPVDWASATSTCPRCGYAYRTLQGRNIGKPVDFGVTLTVVCPPCASDFDAWWTSP